MISAFRPMDRGRWAITPENVAARRADLARLAALSAEARKSRQLQFDFEAEPADACEACGGDGEVDCPRCDGYGCAACDGHGRRDCTCSGGEPLGDDDDGEAVEEAL